MEPAPEIATNLRGNREPNSASKTALTSGMATTSHSSWNISASQLTGSVHIQCGLALVEQETERQPDEHFGRRNCENKQKHYLTIRLPPPRASRDERQAACVEHDLNAQEREDEDPPGQQAAETH